MRVFSCDSCCFKPLHGKGLSLEAWEYVSNAPNAKRHPSLVQNRVKLLKTGVKLLKTRVKLLKTQNLALSRVGPLT
jgi:hypothetical protein